MSTPLSNETWCGTPGGYHRHRRRGQQPCSACAEARRAALKAQRAAKRAGLAAGPKAPEERFWGKVKKTDGNGCWNWMASLDSNGYGQFTINRRPLKAHRYAYELIKGAIPTGLVLDHACRNRRCTNPDHLEPVTNRENVLRGIGLSAIGARRTHCVNGHAFDQANTHIDAHGHRICRACSAANQRRYAARKKARNG